MSEENVEIVRSMYRPRGSEPVLRPARHGSRGGRPRRSGCSPTSTPGWSAAGMTWSSTFGTTGAPGRTTSWSPSRSSTLGEDRVLALHLRARTREGKRDPVRAPLGRSCTPFAAGKLITVDGPSRPTPKPSKPPGCQE